jgi:hypothetical protein
MSDPIVTQGCPFCHAEVLLEGRRLTHAPPMCARYRAWMDAGKEQYREARAKGRAHELLERTENVEPNWAELMREVGNVGLAGATREQLVRWADALDKLDAPYLAAGIRSQLDARGCVHGSAECTKLCPGCEHPCGAHLDGGQCSWWVAAEVVGIGHQCECKRFVSEEPAQ